MVPGMGHCGGGDGPNEFDMIATLEEWREKGQDADRDPRVESQRRTGGADATALPVPQVAKYKGTGSIDKAESFACSAP